MYDSIGNATFEDENGNPVETDEQPESDVEDIEALKALIGSFFSNQWNPFGIAFLQPNTETLAIVRPDERKVGAFRSDGNKGLVKVELTESDIEGISVAMATFFPNEDV